MPINRSQAARSWCMANREVPTIDTQEWLRLVAQRFNPLIGILWVLFVAFLTVAIWAYVNGRGILWQPPCLMLAPLAIYSAAFAGWRVEITADEIALVTFFW